MELMGSHDPSDKWSRGMEDSGSQKNWPKAYVQTQLSIHNGQLILSVVLNLSPCRPTIKYTVQYNI